MTAGTVPARLAEGDAVSGEQYVAWLVALYEVLAKVRREGLMAIEADAEAPQAADSVFARHPLTMQCPYLDFAADLLRLMVGGNLDAGDVEVYAEHAIRGFAAGGADAALLQCIWLTLWASLRGYAPQVAVEFGRQAIPVAQKPGFLDLENAIWAARRAPDTAAEGRPREDMGARIARFVASLDG